MKNLFILFNIIIFLFMVNIAHANGSEPSPELEAWIKNLMGKYHIPGASIVVIKNYKITWAKGFGLRDKEKHFPVTAETLFQAASISKPITAVVALETFSSKHLSIDTDVNQILTSWQIPSNPYTEQEKITLRLLLSHTAGISGFRETGYTTKDKIPTLTEILNGQLPANTPPIRVVRTPNSQFEYSPASYTIVQAILTDIYQQPFAEIMQDLILKPLHMEQSTYLQPLPKSYYQNMAWPYLPNGTLVPNGPYAFPTSAAGGLWSTPTDIAKFMIAIQKALAGQSQENITPQLVNEMMRPGLNHNMGMGFEINVNHYGELTDQNADYFRHGGFQTGYLSMFVGSKKLGNGIVIMCNSAPYMNEKTVNQYDFIAKTIKHIAELEGWQ